MNENDVRSAIREGKTYLGVELGSTRIKGVLITEDFTPIASGSHEWENRLENGIWTYSIDDIWTGIRDCYSDLAKDVMNKYGEKIVTLGGMGFSAMMHGYMVFDKNDELLVPFRTWRNTITEEASEKLTELFGFNIPQRWSIAHLYQAILKNEPHVKDITYMTTLEGYVHWKLTGEKVLGVGDCAGMFPIDSEKRMYNSEMIEKFDKLIEDKKFAWKLEDILPKILFAGEEAGYLTEEGAKLLDPSGTLKGGIPLCPPEGDAGTGMVATNSVAKRTCNVSAGTSVFAMVVLEKDLKKLHKEIDMVTTPSGNPVAMVHCNNCTSEINAWVNLFADFEEAMGYKTDRNKLFETMFNKALEGEKDCGLMSYPYFSGEHITHFDEGRPLFVRKPDAHFTVANLMKTQLYAALGALKTGLDILKYEEECKLDSVVGHGGFFKTKNVGQQVMADAMNAAVTCMETAGEGGAWGAAVLSAYQQMAGKSESLDDFLSKKVFAGAKGTTLEPSKEGVADFDNFMKEYKKGLEIEKSAVSNF